jgi:hypothetical protein
MGRSSPHQQDHSNSVITRQADTNSWRPLSVGDGRCVWPGPPGRSASRPGCRWRCWPASWRRSGSPRGPGRADPGGRAGGGAAVAARAAAFGSALVDPAGPPSGPASSTWPACWTGGCWPPTAASRSWPGSSSWSRRSRRPGGERWVGPARAGPGHGVLGPGGLHRLTEDQGDQVAAASPRPWRCWSTGPRASTAAGR